MTTTTSPSAKQEPPLQPPEQTNPKGPYVTVVGVGLGTASDYPVVTVWATDDGKEGLTDLVDSYKTLEEAITQAVSHANAQAVPFYLRGYDSKGRPLKEYAQQVVPSLRELKYMLEVYDRGADPIQALEYREMVIALARKVLQDKELSTALLVGKRFISVHREAQRMGIAAMLPAIANTYHAAQLVLISGLSLLFPEETYQEGKPRQ